MMQPGETHPEHLLPAQHSAAQAALQLWQNTWNDTIQQMAVMADCLQNVAICLGIDQDVKSALASANGAAQVQSIAASVVGAVAKLSARQLQPEEPDSRQRGPHALGQAFKLEDKPQAGCYDFQQCQQPHHDDCEPSTSSLAPAPKQDSFQTNLPTTIVPFPLNAPSQPSSCGVPLAAHVPRINTADTANRFETTRAVNDTHAQDIGTMSLQRADRINSQSAVVHRAASHIQPSQNFFSPPPGHQGLQRQPHQSPNESTMNADRWAQPHLSPEHAQLRQAQLHVDEHCMQLENEHDSAVNIGESTPPRPAALLRETCLATPVSQRPPDEFSLCAHSELKNSPPVVAKVQGVDRYRIAHAVVHSDQQERLGTAVFNASEAAYDPTHDQECVGIGGAAAQLKFDDRAALGEYVPLQQNSAALFDGVQVEHGASEECVGVAEEDDEDVDDGPKEVCWRVLGAGGGAKAEQAVSRRAGMEEAPSEDCDLQQLPPQGLPPQSVDFARARVATLAGPVYSGPVQRQGRSGTDVSAMPDHFIQHDQAASRTSSVPAHRIMQGGAGWSDRTRNGDAVVGAGDASAVRAAPAMRGAAATADIAGADAGYWGKGKRKAGGVWKARKANILAGKPPKQVQGKPSGRIDRMLSHINAPRSQGTKRTAVAVEHHAHAQVPVAPVAVKGLAGEGCSEENLERRRLEVHAEQAAMQHKGGPRVYDERVRKRAEREALPAWECQGCARFYAMLKRQGYKVDSDVLKCPDCGDDRKTDQENGDVQGILQETSRHRHRFVAPPTPKNFWAIGFDDDWGKGNRRGGQR